MMSLSFLTESNRGTGAMFRLNAAHMTIATAPREGK
jgi:hypothetical protein